MLKGERVMLRRLTAEDVPAVSGLFLVPEVADAWPGDNQSSLREMIEDTDDVVDDLRRALAAADAAQTACASREAAPAGRS